MAWMPAKNTAETSYFLWAIIGELDWIMFEWGLGRVWTERVEIACIHSWVCPRLPAAGVVPKPSQFDVTATKHGGLWRHCSKCGLDS